MWAYNPMLTKICVIHVITFVSYSSFKGIHLWIWRDLLLASLSCSCLLDFVLGSSNFPRSLCFLWFWVGLEILGLVLKKCFFYSNSFYLIWPFNFQKIAPSISKSWKKMSLKLGAKSIKRSWILHWFQKCVEPLHQEVPKDFLSEKW